MYNDLKQAFGETMLQFIVLGLVPGTNLQITYRDVLIMALTVFVAFIIVRELKTYRRRSTSTNKTKQIAV